MVVYIIAESELGENKAGEGIYWAVLLILGWARIMVVLMAGNETVVLVTGMYYGVPINKASCVIGVSIALNVKNLSHWTIIIVQPNPRSR